MAQKAGFSTTIAGPDARGLLSALTAERPGPRSLHIRGTHAATDIAGKLTASGHPAKDVVLYDQVALPLPESVSRDLVEGRFAGITLFSPRSGRLLRKALKEQPLPAACMVFCISTAVAEAVADGLGGTRAVAKTPSAIGMLTLMREFGAR